MLSSAEHSEGIQRRGVILAGLVKLKQICNHPRQYLKEHDTQPQVVAVSGGAEPGEEDAAPIPTDLVLPSRSGKCVRLIQMLDEVLAAGGQALIFSQFRQMGAILSTMLRHELDREVLFLHGGTTVKERDAMVAAFNKSDGSSPLLVLSLKAGGVGLNLTGANHVFHFDRWWNPAVESQATDRAYRIGQTRTVQVHKFVVAGTLEERIDQMIEQKTALLENVIGSGEGWLTEMSLTQLRDVLTLRQDSVAEEGEE
jgi:SNF2 family DNA or RNA helicase